MHIVVMQPVVECIYDVLGSVKSIVVLHDQKAVDKERLLEVNGHHKFVARGELCVCRLVA